MMTELEIEFNPFYKYEVWSYIQFDRGQLWQLQAVKLCREFVNYFLPEGKVGGGGGSGSGTSWHSMLAKPELKAGW